MKMTTKQAYKQKMTLITGKLSVSTVLSKIVGLNVTNFPHTARISYVNTCGKK